MREKIVCTLTVALTYIVRTTLKLFVSVVKRCYFIDKKRREEAVRYLQIKREQLLVCDFLLPLLNIKTNDQKFLLCMPMSGLNDLLVIINRCVNYAISHNRIIYIDGIKSGFLDDFDRYFTVRERETMNIKLCRIDALILPLEAYPKRLKQLFLSQIHKKSRSVISFDLNRSYNQGILVYVYGTGGDDSIGAFSFLDLAPAVRSHIHEKIENLGDYDAVHIRHSDYTTDYKPFLQEIYDRHQTDRKIVLCTDSYEVQQYAKELFQDKIICVNDIPDTNGKTLHCNPDLERYQTNLATLCDLFVLAWAKTLYMTHIDRDHYGKFIASKRYISGFGRLAMALRQHPKLTKRLIYGDDQTSGD
jgi:hypothetical protein